MHGGDAAYVSYPYKLLVGLVRQNGWPGQVHPNASNVWDSFEDVANCSSGCLFDVVDDPQERVDLAQKLPQKTHELYEKLKQAPFYDPDRGTPNPRACDYAKRTGFWSPFLP